MLPILRPDSLPDTDNSLYLPDSGLSLATLILGAPGTGKTTLESLLALQWLLKGYGQVILDPTGTLSAALIFRLLRFLAPFPPEEHGLLWQRVRYVPVGAKDFVVPFPIYYGLESGQSLWQVAERFLNVLRLSHPKLVTDAPVTWPSIHRIGSNAGMVLAALGYQLTEVEDLLFNTSEWEKSGRFEEAIKRCPESAPAVSYFRNHYLPLSRTDKHRLTSTFLDHVFALSANPQHRLLFGASTQGLDWEESLEQLGQAVILDLHRLSDPETRRFALLWIFQNLYEHITQQGRRTTL
jgi:hypothetical protein